MYRFSSEESCSRHTYVKKVRLYCVEKYPSLDISTGPHLRDLLYICLKPETQEHGMVFNMRNVGSKV